MKSVSETGTVAATSADSRAVRLLTSALALLLGVGLGWALWLLPEPSAETLALVRTSLPDSGVRNPVTAVLLNFRGYHTLLEVAVLLLAAFAGRFINGRCADRMPVRLAQDSFLAAFFRLGAAGDCCCRILAVGHTTSLEHAVVFLEVP